MRPDSHDYADPQFVQQPTERWRSIEQALEIDVPSGDLSYDRTLSGRAEAVVKDTSPHEFMDLVPVAFRLDNILPELDLPDGAAAEDVEKAFRDWCAAFAESVQAEGVFRAALGDAVAYGCSYVQVQVSADSPADEPADVASDDGLILLRHDQVQFTGSWERPGLVRLSLPYRLSRLGEFVMVDGSGAPVGEPLLSYEDLTAEEQECGVFVVHQDWDYRDHTMRLLHNDTPVSPVMAWPTRWGPAIVRLAYGIGETQELRDYPAGLIAPWLSIRAVYISLLADLSLYTAKIVNNPTFASKSILASDESAWEREFYGSAIVGVDDAFFTDGGHPMAWQMPIAAMPKEFYDHLAATKRRMDEASHMSDIMRGHQFQQGTSATEAQAIMEVQSQWLRAQQSTYRAFVENVWRVIADMKGIQGRLALSVPDQHSLDPQLKLQRAERLMQLIQFDSSGQFLDLHQAFQEMAELLGCSNKLIKVNPGVMTPDDVPIPPQQPMPEEA